jgi:hypothetical protein
MYRTVSSQKSKCNWPKTHEKMFCILGHEGNANQTTLRFPLTPGRTAIISNTTTNAGEDSLGKGTLTHCWWDCKLVQPLWKAVKRFLKKTKDRPTI